MKTRKLLKRTGLYLLCLALLLSLLPRVAQAAEAAAERLDNTTTVISNEKIIVSLGDSYSSGEGIPDFYGQDRGTPGKYSNEDWLAHRSKTAWPSRLRLPSMAEGDCTGKHRNTTWYFAASSGAVTDNIRYTGETVTEEKTKFVIFKETETYRRGQQRKDYGYFPNPLGSIATYTTGKYYLPGQLDIFNQIEPGTVDYVTMTIGGNDAKFADVVTEAVLGSTYLDTSSLSTMLNEIWYDYYRSGGIRDNMRSAYERVAAAAGDQATIIIAGYPELLDRDGKGAVISKEEAVMIDDAVVNFNKEIENLVNSCAAGGMNICFVPVAQKFVNRQAYSHADEWNGENEEYINRVMFGARSEDLKAISAASSYSMHPNDKGAQAYADAVNEKLKELEANGGKPAEHTRQTSDVRDIVLVLDTSGSMEGTPIRETIKASSKFIETILQEDASIGIVTFDSSAMLMSDFSMDEAHLKDVVSNMIAGGGTNTESGLSMAANMLRETNAQKKIIVLMSDGLANRGATGSALIQYANTLKDEGILIYTLGFFEDLYSSEKREAQNLMEGIASDGCHYEVEDVDKLVFFFGDIADQINGTEYVYIRIACPVDVKVTYNGETLSSSGSDYNTRTSFGSLTFEEGEGTGYSYSGDNRTKILRMREGADYSIQISGNGEGTMHYTVGFMDSSGEYTDLREIEEVPITEQTFIVGNALRDKATTLQVDEDGDGRIDKTYSAGGPADEGMPVWAWILIGVGALLVIGLVVFLILKLAKKRKTAAPRPAPARCVDRIDTGYAGTPAAYTPPAAAAYTPPAAAAYTPPAAGAAAGAAASGLKSTVPSGTAPAAPAAASGLKSTVPGAPAAGSGLKSTVRTGSAGAPKARSRFCGNCGAPIDGAAPFCANCGAKL